MGPLLTGALITIQLTVMAALFGGILAILAGVAKMYGNAAVRAFASVYVEVFRGTSALVQLFWFFFALPLIGIQLTAMAAGVVVLALNLGAYGAEVVRGAVKAVPKGQWEACLALNMTRVQALRHVVLPQALVAMLPPASNLVIELLKNTALVSLITIPEITFQAQTLRAATLQTTAIFSLVLLIYFLIAMVLVYGFRRLEANLSQGLHLGRAH
ncbi:MAG: ectoine/hydroxyectoine ABC transporter permease subunit EhuC [Vulcanimicrobiota bacterium]